MTFAAYPMYEIPENRAAVDAWWQGLARHLHAAGLEQVPERLERRCDFQDRWCDDALLFSQTCGYPLTHALKDRVRVIATPCYAAPGCEGPRYSSVVLVRAEDPARGLADLAGRRAAFNARHSQSGYNALRHALAPVAGGAPMLAGLLETGRHGASIAAVADGRADVAAIDCVTWALLARHRPAGVAGLRVLAHTASAPGLPFITARGASDARLAGLRAGLRGALEDPALAEARAALLLVDAVVLPEAAYAEIDRMERDAVEGGYPELA